MSDIFDSYNLASSDSGLARMSRQEFGPWLRLHALAACFIACIGTVCLAAEADPTAARAAVAQAVYAASAT